MPHNSSISVKLRVTATGFESRLRTLRQTIFVLCWVSADQWRTQEFFPGGGSTNSVEDRGQRERGSGGGSPLVRGSGGSCKLVQEVAVHMVKFS